MFKFQRGEVYLVEESSNAQGSEQKKTRPWVLVGASIISSARSTVVALPLSTQAPEKLPIAVQVLVNNSKVTAVIDQIRALDKKRFKRFEGALTDYEMGLIDDGLHKVLAL